MEWEQPAKSDSDYKSQIMEEAEVEAILSGKEKGKILPQIQTQQVGAEEAEEGEILEETEEGEILEETEEGEIPQIPMQQGQHPQTPIPTESATN